jgi:hypothetical protein
MNDIEELIWSTEPEDRWKALKNRDLTIEHLKILALDPEIEIEEKATEILKKRNNSPSVKVHFELFPECQYGVESESYLNLNFGFPPFGGELPVHFHFPIDEQVLPGYFSSGYMTPLRPEVFLFYENDRYIVTSPKGVYGEVEITEILDEDMKATLR